MQGKRAIKRPEEGRVQFISGVIKLHSNWPLRVRLILIKLLRLVLFRYLCDLKVMRFASAYYLSVVNV